MAEHLIFLIYIILYGLPLIGIICILTKNLRVQIWFLRNKSAEEPGRERTGLKIFLLSLGIVYGGFCFIGLTLFAYKPSWFHPPKWLVISFIVLFVPYLAFVLGLVGLVYMGHGGASPSKMVQKAMKSAQDTNGNPPFLDVGT